MRILISGATGLIGSALVVALLQRGHELTRLVRSHPRQGDVLWDGQTPIELSVVSGFDAVIHLAGETISKPWTPEQRRKIRESRVTSTRNLVHGVVHAPIPPKSLLCASAVGIYGDRGNETLDESAPPGTGFLAEVAKQWEAETNSAAAAGIRVVNLRTSLVLSDRGGALRKMANIFRFGLGGRLGSGNQYWSWISIRDWVSAAEFILANQTIAGPVNLSSPTPVTNAEFTKALAKVLRRPAILPAPAFALRLFLGPMADELLLSSARVVPKKLLDSGFEFRFPDLEGALRDLLSKPIAAG